MRPFVVVAVLALSAIAGCAEPEATSETQPEEPLPFQSRPLATVATANVTDDAAAAPLTRDDWLVLPLQATPEGTVAGFRFPIPPGALVPTWYDEEQKHLVLELAVIGEGKPEAVHIEMGQSGEVLAEWTGIDAPVGGASVNEKGLSGLSGELIYADVQEGTEAFLVAGVLGSGDATLGVRFRDQDPFTAVQSGGDYEYPAADGKEFLAKVAGRQGVYVEPVAQASGLTLGVLHDYHSLVLPYWNQVIYGAITVEQAVPDTPVKPLTLVEAVANSGPGYASQTAWVWTGAHTGTMDIRLQTPDGEVRSVAGPIVPDPTVQSTIVLASGEGDGDAALEFSMQAAGVSPQFPQLTVLVHVGFAASLSELAGEPVAPRGMASDAIPVRMGDHAYLRTPQGTLSFDLGAVLP